MRAVRGADRRPHTLFTMQPTRMPAARLRFGDVVPEGMDRTRKLERLQTHRRARRWFIEFKTQESGLESGQIHITASATRPLCGVQRLPAMTADRTTNTKAARGCIAQPIDDQSAIGARLDRIDRKPRPNIVRSEK